MEGLVRKEYAALPTIEQSNRYFEVRDLIAKKRAQIEDLMVEHREARLGMQLDTIRESVIRQRGLMHELKAQQARELEPLLDELELLKSESSALRRLGAGTYRRTGRPTGRPRIERTPEEEQEYIKWRDIHEDDGSVTQVPRPEAEQRKLRKRLEMQRKRDEEQGVRGFMKEDT